MNSERRSAVGRDLHAYALGPSPECFQVHARFIAGAIIYEYRAQSLKVFELS